MLTNCGKALGLAAVLDVIANADEARARIAYYAEWLEGWISGVSGVAAYL